MSMSYVRTFLRNRQKTNKTGEECRHTNFHDFLHFAREKCKMYMYAICYGTINNLLKLNEVNCKDNFF